MNIWHEISIDRINPDEFISCIEIPKGSKNKYELDKDSGLLVLDRILHTSTHYPANYGLIPRTYSEDKDPLDVLVLSQSILEPLVLVKSVPIGVIKMIDDNETDEKIIAVPQADPAYNLYNDIEDLPPHIFEEISHFFEIYKQLEHKKTSVKEVLGKKEALNVIDRSIKKYREEFSDKL